jgi:hypothetical protein
MSKIIYGYPTKFTVLLTNTDSNIVVRLHNLILYSLTENDFRMQNFLAKTSGILKKYISTGDESLRYDYFDAASEIVILNVTTSIEEKYEAVKEEEHTNAYPEFLKHMEQFTKHIEISDIIINRLREDICIATGSTVGPNGTIDPSCLAPGMHIQLLTSCIKLMRSEKDRKFCYDHEETIAGIIWGFEYPKLTDEQVSIISRDYINSQPLIRQIISKTNRKANPHKTMRMLYHFKRCGIVTNPLLYKLPTSEFCVKANTHIFAELDKIIN